VAVVAAAVFAVAGVAYATIPDGSWVYNAYMLRGVGTIRLIDPTAPKYAFDSHCSGVEQQISWNQTGAPWGRWGNGPAGTGWRARAEGRHRPAGTDRGNGSSWRERTDGRHGSARPVRHGAVL